MMRLYLLKKKKEPRDSSTEETIVIVQGGRIKTSLTIFIYSES